MWFSFSDVIVLFPWCHVFTEVCNGHSTWSHVIHVQFHNFMTCWNAAPPRVITCYSQFIFLPCNHTLCTWCHVHFVAYIFTCHVWLVTKLMITCEMWCRRRWTRWGACVWAGRSPLWCSAVLWWVLHQDQHWLQLCSLEVMATIWVKSVITS